MEDVDYLKDELSIQHFSVSLQKQDLLVEVLFMLPLLRSFELLDSHLSIRIIVFICFVWSPGDPSIYNAESSSSKEGILVDLVATALAYYFPLQILGPPILQSL